MKRLHLLLFVMTIAAHLAPPPGLAAPGQEEPAPETEPAADAAEEGPTASGNNGGGAPSGLRPYARVITDAAVSQPGIFTVHQVGARIYYEIPATELGREFLWVGRISRTTAGTGFGGQQLDERVVRWERRENQIFLKNVSYGLVAAGDRAIARAVQAANNETILMTFDIATLGANDAPVIEVTNLFVTEIPEFSARTLLQARGFDRRRSYIDSVRAFPENIEVRAAHTYTRPPDGGGVGRGMAPGSATVEMAFSMVKLPEEPMTPRLFDERVGYFSVMQVDFGTEEHRAVRQRYITRWRLDKQDPDAEISDPVKPIVYWIDPATPEPWVPYVKQGVEDWQEAFEAAGFRNAIVAREAPSPEADPYWSPEDARHSVIRWLPSSVENAYGPHVHDPRTGEILESDIELHHNVQNLLRDWYFVQVAPLDPRARTLPLPDELMGRLIRFVVAHEVGHALGFQHNMKASSTYPFEKIRDPEWLREMSHTPSIMDYARFNYVAQPEDNIPVEDLVPRIGPYDRWATMWGYKPIPDAATPEAERTTLDAWARVQDDTPWYRFSTNGSGAADPGNLTEAVGDANAIEATRLGQKNLERVMDLLLEAAAEDGRSWSELESLYGRVLGQWVREMNHVAALVGGFDAQDKHAGQEGVRFTPVSADMQRAAVQFLNENAFRTPAFMIRPEILRRIEPDGILARLRNSQRSVLDFLLDSGRFARLVEQKALDDSAYGPESFLADLRRGIWAELAADAVSTDPFRRNTQRLYLDLVRSRLSEGGAAWNDLRAFLRGELRDLDGQIQAALSRTNEAATRFHLQDVRDQIALILDPAVLMTAGGGLAPDRGAAEAELDPFNPYVALGCWTDFAIAP